MHTFFHDWRRKAGGVTLVMALATTGMWLRSHYEYDDIFVYVGSGHILYSENGQACWCRMSPFPATANTPWFRWSSVQAPDLANRYLLSELWQPPGCVWASKFGGMTFGAVDEPIFDMPVRRHYWVVPYSLITIPLTLLSAYLILWQPRKRGFPN